MCHVYGWFGWFAFTTNTQKQIYFCLLSYYMRHSMKYDDVNKFRFYVIQSSDPLHDERLSTGRFKLKLHGFYLWRFNLESLPKLDIYQISWIMFPEWLLDDLSWAVGTQILAKQFGAFAKLAYIHICNLNNQLQLIGECYRVFIKYCVFSKILIYFPDSVFSRCQYVYTRQTGRTSALQQNWQSSENSNFF